jgi:hypothetical protein
MFDVSKGLTGAVSKKGSFCSQSMPIMYWLKYSMFLPFAHPFLSSGQVQKVTLLPFFMPAILSSIDINVIIPWY